MAQINRRDFLILGGGTAVGLPLLGGAGAEAVNTREPPTRFAGDAASDEGALARCYEPRGPVNGLSVVAPSTVIAGEEFFVGVRMLIEPYTAPLNCFTEHYPTVSSSTSLSPRGISYMDNVPPQWQGVLEVESEAPFKGPSRVRFEKKGRPYAHDQRPIRRIGPFRYTKPGIHYLAVRNCQNGIRQLSNPIEVVDKEPAQRLYWGDIHGHTILTDGIRSPEEYYFFGRDEAFLDICALSDHAEFYLTDRQWEYLTQATNDFNRDGRFVTLIAQEWTSRLGHRNLYHAGDSAPRVRATDPKYGELSDLYAFAHKHGAIVVPHHSASAAMGVDWSLGHDPEVERLVEIYSGWGSSERPPEEGNHRAIHSGLGGEKSGQHVRDAFRLGRPFGIIAAGDIHDGRPGDYLGFRQAEPANYRFTQPGGLMGVWCRSLDRKHVFEALWNRRVYGTSGPRILLRFSISGRSMGAQVKRQRHMAASVQASSEVPIARIDLVKDGEDYRSVRTKRHDVRWRIDIDPAEPPGAYYARVTRQDGEMAWSSPVWVHEG